MKYFSAMNEVWDEWLIAGSSPTRACVESRLAVSTLAVEIAVTAAVMTN
jgi:enamine deaminase RidA (YjgF/YER057c/UK114 family)